jgi:hypothetical protein
MPLYLNMPKALHHYYTKELAEAKKHLKEGQLQQCWYHYERAHILGQRWPIQHCYVHFKMLQFGIRIKSKKEVIGQLIRLVFGGVKSFVGTVPIGNTGGANVPPLQPMPIAEDLQMILDKTISIKRK